MPGSTIRASSMTRLASRSKGALFASSWLMGYPRAFVEITFCPLSLAAYDSPSEPLIPGTRSPHAQSTLSFGTMCPNGFQRCIRSFHLAGSFRPETLAELSRPFFYRAANQLASRRSHWPAARPVSISRTSNMAAKKQASKGPGRSSNSTSFNSSDSAASAGVAKSSSRSTVSGPTRNPHAAQITDAATAKIAGTEAVAAAFPYNAAKPSEFGDASMEPATGTGRRAAASYGDRQHADRVQRIGKGREGQSADQLQSVERTARSRTRRFGRPCAHDEPGRAGRGQSEFAQGGLARSDSARRLHPAREDHAFRS